ncbi:MAG: PLDc_N domain-containing protein [Candidatus Omnitrophica bacterium]|nr:PLDc_N domain-containing protein [Candidatus Omnitrophota bacterium]
MEFLMTAAIVIFEIIAVVDVLRGFLPIVKKLLWIILIVCVPVVGIVLYFLIGRPEYQEAKQV